jgi:XRE family transcriptional regulator, regulator of sulfur utilization
MTVRELVGQNIKKWREFRGMKQEVLGKLLFISKAAISQMENGKTDVTISRLEAISKALQLDFIQMFFSPQQMMKFPDCSGLPPAAPEHKLSDHYPTQNFLYELLKAQLAKKDQQAHPLQSPVHQEAEREPAGQIGNY